MYKELLTNAGFRITDLGYVPRTITRAYLVENEQIREIIEVPYYVIESVSFTSWIESPAYKFIVMYLLERYSKLRITDANILTIS